MLKKTIFLFLFLLKINSIFAQNDFIRIQNPITGMVSSFVSLENDRAHVWSSKLYSDNPASNIYGKGGIPSLKVPAIHNYNGNSYQLLAIELPLKSSKKLPDNCSIKSYADFIKIFISVELADDQQLSFRPHRFVDRLCPKYIESPHYSRSYQIEASVFDIHGNLIPFNDPEDSDKKPIYDEERGFSRAGISIHSNLPEANAYQEDDIHDIVASPANMLLPATERPHLRSKGYISTLLFKDAVLKRGFDGNFRDIACITFHWLLTNNNSRESGSSDFEKFQDLCLNSNNPIELLIKLRDSTLSGQAEFGLFEELISDLHPGQYEKKNTTYQVAQ